MGKSSGGKIQVTDYYLSGHWRICHGPVDEFLELQVGEKVAWSGSATAETPITIYAPSMFGGPQKEGGLNGVAHYLPGGPTQMMPAYLASKLGLTPETCPAYRGMASIFFAGATAGQGFLWGSNNPYLRSFAMKVRRRSRGLSESLAFINADGVVDSNPAHIIHECKTNTEWGEGGAPTGFDIPSFEGAAQTLFNEGFGLSLTWAKQSDIDSFVQEVLDHIQATLFVHPRTGLITLKLIRSDYDIESLPILNADNCKVISFDRKGWGETVNEIVVTWTNPENEQEETVAAQNNANIAVQGGIISDSRNYYAVRRSVLAQELALRDLATASAPLAAFEIEADRTMWQLIPGGCARLQYPEYGIDDVVVRLGKIDYGKAGSPSIKISALEDIFARDRADYDISDGSQWLDPARDPAPAAYSRIITAPAYFVGRVLTAADADTLTYPEVLAATLVSQNNSDTYGFMLYGTDIQPDGSVVAEIIGNRPTVGHAFLMSKLEAEASSVITFPTSIGGPGPRPGAFAFIGDVNERAQEIVLLDNGLNNQWSVRRGCLDTVPRAWPAGTPVFFVSTDSQIVIDSETFSDMETVTFKIAPSTSRGTLPFDQAPLVAGTLSARPHLPTRPANVKVGGTGFGSVDLSDPAPTVVTVTWSNRNRTMEDTVIFSWTEGDTQPESGQTTTIRLYSTDGVLLTTHAGLTGTSFDVPIASFNGENIADIEVSAVRSNLESLQAHRIRVKVAGDDENIGDPSAPPPEPDPEPDPDYPVTYPPWKPGAKEPNIP